MIKPIKHCYFICLLIINLLPVLWAQNETPPPCVQFANSDWYKVSKAEIGDILDTWISHYYWTAWRHTTSILPAEGIPPKNPYKNYEELTDDEIELYLKSEKKITEWSCMYGPERAVDNDSSTAWCEGVEGTGIGEIIVVYIGNVKKVGIWPGFGRSDKLFRQNGRPSTLKLHILEAMQQSPTQMDINIGPFVKLADHYVQLKDTNELQIIDLPNYSLLAEKNKDDYAPINDPIYLAVEIIDVYQGSKYQDTLITEIKPIP